MEILPAESTICVRKVGLFKVLKRLFSSLASVFALTVCLLVALLAVTTADWEERPARYQYAPPSYAKERFVRATQDPTRLLEVANCFYQKTSPAAEPWVCLEIDTMGLRMSGIEMKMVTSESDPTLVCPHVYGQIPEETVRNVYPVQRDATTAEFLFVTGLTDVCQSHK